VLKSIANVLVRFRLPLSGIILLAASLLAMSRHNQIPIRFNYELQGRYQLIALETPDSAFFAGERLPVTDMDVKQRLDRELTKQVMYGGGSALHLKRYKYYFKKVRPIIQQLGLHPDFAYVAAVESGFQPIVSGKGAAGYWQIMDASGRKFGLEINNEVDERYHLEYSTRAACRIFIAMKKEFGSWANALAAYNMGNGALSRSMASQGTNNYFDLKLNRETGKYLYKVVALKEVIERAENYGIKLNKGIQYGEEPVKYIPVKSSIPNLQAWANERSVPLRVIKLYNPWLKGSRLTIKAGKSYRIAIPINIKRFAEISEEPLLTLADEDTSSYADSLLINQDEKPKVFEKEKTIAKTETPNAAAAATVTTPIPESNTQVPVTTDGLTAQRTKVIIHKIAKGESLSKLAVLYDVPVAEILKANKKLKRKSTLALDQEIRIPPQKVSSN
jgi:LysM repeat protein